MYTDDLCQGKGLCHSSQCETHAVLGRGTANTLFDDWRMGRLREQALADVDEEWRAKLLSCQNVKRTIEPFPSRAEPDMYVEGMDDDWGPG